MFPFNWFPGTNMHDLDLDWLIKSMRDLWGKMKDLRNDMETFTIETAEKIKEYVDEWLDDHPEATTTVEDGSITAQKLNSDFLLRVENNYVTLQMFGGVCDGQTDDHNAFNQALAYASKNGKTVLIRTFDVVRIDGAVFVPSNTRLVINGSILCNYGATACLETFDRVAITPGYTGTHNILIEGWGTIDGGGSVSTFYGVTPIRIHHSKDVTIRNITIKDWVNNHAIETSSENVVIDNVKFLGCVQTTSDGNHSEAVQLDICTSGSASGAIPYDNTRAKNTVIKNCLFAPSEAGLLYAAIGNHGTVFDDSFGTMYTGLKILNNIFQYSRDNTINLLMNVEDIEICGNRFENQIFAGSTLNDGNILLSYYIRNAKIHNNVFIDSLGSGINIGYLGDTGAGTYENDWMTNINISDNVFYNYCTRNTNNSGIILAHKAKSIAIHDNVFNTINQIGAVPVRVQDATNNSTYLQNTVISPNTYNGKEITYENWSQVMTINSTYQIPAYIMNGVTMKLFAYRYAVGGSTVIDIEDIKAGYLASGAAIYIDNERYFKFTISTTGLVTLTEKGSSSGDPYMKASLIL